VAIRVNPDVDPRTHPYIATGLEKSKFGVPHAAVVELATTLAARPGIELVGLAFHLGSQMLDLAPVLDGLDRVLRIADELARSGFHLRQLDIGGGIGIRYAASQVDPNLPAFAGGVAARLRGRTLSLLLEPGRFLVGNAGVLLTRVLYPKVMGARRLWVVDAAMNDLLRPALYQARHEVVAARAGAGLEDPVEIVGPVCESTDVLASDRRLPRLAAGDVLAVLGAGAYGSVMASNYNSRPRPAEVLVDGNRVAVLRPRETLADLIARDAVDLEWCTL
jgi:diaminopimelate decarboxylase